MISRPDIAARWGRGLAAVAVSGLVVLTMTGCGEPLKSAQQSFLRGDYESAEATLAKAAKKNRSGSDAVLLWLEYASMLHHLGEYERSSEAFLVAEERIRAIDGSPAVSVSEETRVALTNPEETVYRGTGYDRIMAPTLRGLNAMFAGEVESARQAFIEAGFQRQAAEDLRAEQIDKARAAQKRADESANIERTTNDPQAQAKLQEMYARLDQFQPYADYANPFSEWLQAVYLLGVQIDPSDADRARSLLNRVLGMVPENPFVQADFASAEAATRGEALEGVTYVVFATGTAPFRAGERIDLPLFLVNREVDYVGVAIPVLHFNRSFEESLLVEAGGSSTQTAVLADMDRVISADFNAERGALITRQIAGAIVKAAAAWGVNQAAKQSNSAEVELLVRLATIFYQVAMNKTDNRSWISLPKQYQYARVTTPASGEIELRRPSGESRVVDVAPDGVKIVYARSVGPGLPMTVDSVALGVTAAVGEPDPMLAGDGS